MLGVVLLSIMTDEKGTPLLDLADGAKNGVPWSAIMLACSVLALSKVITLPALGITDFLLNSLQPVLSGISPRLFLPLIVGCTLLMTNLSSNMVTLTMMYTISVPLAISIGGMVSGAAIACVIGLASSFAWSTPAATCHAALACGSRWMKSSELFKYGMLLVYISLVVIWIFGYPLLKILV
jgi:sodium-dependent dicarboxylate transporter 2/3/5